MSHTEAMRTITRVFTALALVAAASIAMAAPSNAANKPTLVVTELPAQVRLIPGESIVLSLTTNRTTGYSWSTKVSGDKKAIKVGEGIYQAPASPDGMVGVPGTTLWTITAKSVGTAKVKVLATPPGGGDPSSDGVLTIIVMKG